MTEWNHFSHSVHVCARLRPGLNVTIFGETAVRPTCLTWSLNIYSWGTVKRAIKHHSNVDVPAQCVSPWSCVRLPGQCILTFFRQRIKLQWPHLPKHHVTPAWYTPSLDSFPGALSRLLSFHYISPRKITWPTTSCLCIIQEETLVQPRPVQPDAFSTC